MFIVGEIQKGYYVEMNKSIGMKVKEARKGKKFSREQVARKIGVSQQQVARYESGENSISADRLALIATVLQKPIDYFYN